MIKSITKKTNNKKGFTLIELIVVIAILGILAAIAIPRFVNSRATAEISAHNGNVRTLESAANLWLAEKGLPADDKTWNGTAVSPATEEWKAYLQAWPKPVGTRTVYSVTISKADGTISVSPAAE